MAPAKGKLGPERPELPVSPKSLSVQLADLRAVERHVSDQSFLGKHKAEDRSLQSLGVIVAAGTLRQHGYAGVCTHCPTLGTGEFIQCFLGHEHDDLIVLCDTQCEADRG